MDSHAHRPTVVRMALTVFMVDDNRTFLAAAGGALATLPGVTVIGHAGCGRDALAQIEALKPDLVLLDIGLPDISGVEVGSQLCQWRQPPHIIYVSLHDLADYANLVHDMGAAVFVNKADFVTELLPLVTTFTETPARGTHK